MTSAFTLSRKAQARAQTVVDRMKKAKGLRQRGFMSIELGLVLLVVALLIAAAVLFYRDTQRKNSINNNVADIVFVSGNLVSKYGQLNRYAEVTTALAVKSGVVPAHLRDAGADTATNRYGGAIAIAPASLSAASDTVQITWPNVPAAQCSSVVTGVEGEFRYIVVAGTEVKPIGGNLDLTALETACDTGVPSQIDFFVGRT